MSNAPRRGRAVLRLLGTTVLLPLAVLLLGLWEQQRGGADLVELETQRLQMMEAVTVLETRPDPGGRLDMGMQFRRNGRTYVGPLALAQAREALDDVEGVAAVARWRGGAASCLRS